MDLKQFWFFSSLTDEEIVQLNKIITIKQYPAGTILFYEKDSPTYLYLLASGSAKLYKYDLKGNEIVLHTLKGPNFIAEIANFDESFYPANCLLESESTVYLIDYKQFKENFLTKSDISLAVIKSLIKKIKAIEQFITYSMTIDSYGKIVKFLYENEDLLPNIKQVKIASLLNITPETLSRNIAKLKQKKIIDKSNGCIKIINHQELQKLLN